jgi:hypothetical protein
VDAALDAGLSDYFERLYKAGKPDGSDTCRAFLYFGGPISHEMARDGMARHGMARDGTAWHGMT